MVGRRLAVFAAWEVKDGEGRLTTDQARFLRHVEAGGGIAACVRSTDDALNAKFRE